VAILSLLVVPVLGDFRYFAIPGLLLLSSIGYSFSRHHVMHPGPAEHGIVADMTEAINKRVPAGVPVQPIDWTTGAVQALLRTEHPIAADGVRVATRHLSRAFLFSRSIVNTRT
jgi:hypothetical protein